MAVYPALFFFFKKAPVNDAECKYLLVGQIWCWFYLSLSVKHDIAIGLLNTAKTSFQRYIQQISADLNFSVFFKRDSNSRRGWLPLSIFVSSFVNPDISITTLAQVTNQLELFILLSGWL